MCGELDDDLHIDNEVFDRFLAIAGRHGVVPDGEPRTLPDLDDPAGRSSYMDALFRAGLARAVSDAAGAGEGRRVEAIAAQSIAFARLAGFLAGQLPPEADLFRVTVEALTDGHALPSRAADEIRRERDHHHGHHHGHDEAHGHDH